MTNGKADPRDKMRVADQIMAEDRAMLRALGQKESGDEMPVVRAVMAKRTGALRKLAE